MFDQSIADSCIVRNACAGHGVICSELCVGYSELNNQLALSGIPKKYLNVGTQPSTIRAVADMISEQNPKVAQWLQRFSNDLERHVSQGNGLYLYSGQTGTGKTTVATSIGLDYIRMAVSNALSNGKALNSASVLFVHVPTFLRMAKTIYENDQGMSAQASQSVGYQTRRMAETTLLILDDIGAEKPSETVRERLLTLIDGRVIDGLSTIYSSNLSLNELEVSLGARIRSRIEGSSIVLPFGGKDNRRRG